MWLDGELISEAWGGKGATSRNQDTLALNKIVTEDSLGACHICSCIKPKILVHSYDFKHMLSNDMRKKKQTNKQKKGFLTFLMAK